MNNLLLPLQFINGILSKITFFIAMAIVCVMVLALSASALTRYISGHGFDWFIELPPALVSWLVFPMLGPLLKTGNHIEVDFVSTILSAKNIKYIKRVLFEHHYHDMIKKNYKFGDVHALLNKNNFEQIYKAKMPFRITFEYIYRNRTY